MQLLHFIVPAIIVFGLLPEFLKPIEYKLEMLQTFYTKNNYLMLRKTGIFPAGFIQPFLLVYGLAYTFASVYYITRVKKDKGPQYCESNKILLRWIMLVATVILTFVLLQSIQYLSLLIKGDFSFLRKLGKAFH